MHVAASNGHLNAVNFLLLQGVSVHSKYVSFTILVYQKISETYFRDRYDASPLVDAARKCHYDVIKALVKAGAHLKMNSISLGVELCRFAF